ncbi:MAG: hypothetical protein V8S22_10420 [Lachnospiraceae bacterium]
MDAFYASKEKELDEIYDALVKNRTAQAKALGYENFTELGYNRMIRNSYRRTEVEKFRDQIKKDWVPLAEELWENRRVRLGLANCISAMKASASRREVRNPSEVTRTPFWQVRKCTGSFLSRPENFSILCWITIFCRCFPEPIKKWAAI